MRKMKDSGIEWIGDIPEDWKRTKLKNLIIESNSGEVIDKSYWNIGNEILYSCSKTTIMCNYSKFPEHKRTVKGDLLLTRNATPYIFIPEENAIYTNVVQRIKLNDKVNLRFIKYMLQSSSNSIKGYGDIIESFNMNVWGNTWCTLPSLEEQELIAYYLDDKVKEIDNIISKTKETIEEYKKYKQSVITEAVTKGLNPNVEMKDSGIEWIGEIPNHWALVKVKQIFDIGRGRVISKLELDENEKYPVYSSQTQNNGCLGYIKSFDFDVDQLTWTTDGANAGTIFLRKGKYNCTNVCGTLCPKQNYYNLNYLKYDLGYIAFFHKRHDTNGFKIMNNEMAEIKILYPTLEEQKLIANYLDSKIFKIDKLICKKEQLISQLEEYKKSLIYEYVTGKKEVSVSYAD